MDEVRSPAYYDENLFSRVKVNTCQILRQASQYTTRRHVSKQNQLAWALHAIQLTDFTTLAGDDSASNVQRLCHKAKHPLSESVLHALKDVKSIDATGLHVAAVCVYPSQVARVKAILGTIDAPLLPIASVAAGFPSGQYELVTRLAEIRGAVEAGASEIDIVISRPLVLNGRWDELYNEVTQMRLACGGGAHMKAILATGELGSLGNVYRASYVCMLAGADFIKTSTGKETVNATIPVTLVMLRAIRDFDRQFQRKVGFKPAGGIRTVKDAILWMTVMKEELGPEWLRPSLFRIGASGLLSDVELFVANQLNDKRVDVSKLAFA